MDLISDALTRIRNAVQRNKKEVTLKQNKLIVSLAEILKSEGFVDEFSQEDGWITLQLSFVNEKPVMTHLERVSSGGQRIYVDADELKPVLSGRGIGVISTSKGVMTLEKARKEHVGGEYICKIW